MKVKKLIARVSAVGVSLLMLPTQVYAQASWLDGIGYEGDMDSLIKTVLNTAIIMAAVVAVAYLVYNGFKYMMAAGDTAKTEEAQKGIANALIGLVVCLAAAVVINFVLGRLGLETEDLD